VLELWEPGGMSLHPFNLASPARGRTLTETATEANTW
jgi:hypothetical protein